MFFKIGVLESFTNSTGKQLSWSLFLVKFEHLFYGTPPVTAFENGNI